MADGASDYWSKHSERGYAPSWFGLCADEITRRATGQTAVALTSYLVSLRAPKPRENVLELGCLTGKKIRSIRAKKQYGIDIAEGAIAEGKKLYPELDLRVMDLNAPTPIGVKFDLIMVNGVLHHIANLEACADWIVEHLSPRGVLIASEYTGPVRYRYSRAEVAAINEAVALLPADLRETFDPASLNKKLAADPSESIRSRDIANTLRAAGLDVQELPYGGNSLQRALGPHFFKHFDPANAEHVAGLERVIDHDTHLMTIMPSHHAVMVGKPT